MEEALVATTQRAQKQLSLDLQSILDNEVQTSATVLFHDPHTDKQIAHSVHPFMVMHNCPVLRSLLKPLVDGTKQSNQQGTVLAKSGASGSKGSRRGLIIGPVRIPLLSVKPVLRYLYTLQFDVSAEAAFPTLLAAHTLQLPLLQAYCESIVSRQQVNFDTCCEFLALSLNYDACLLEELSLLTAAVGFDTVSKTSQFNLQSSAVRSRIEKVAKELKGKWVPPPAAQTEQKSAEVYARRFSSSQN